MKENGYKRTKNTMLRLMKYIYTISPKYFILNIAFTILIGLTSAMTVWATKLLINGIAQASTNQGNNFMGILIAYGAINMREKIEKFPEKIDTQMGKWFGGEELSKGQWQRIALGRAFIRDADLYILDEPTASLDPISEKEIFNIMLQKSKGKICLFITHRLENIIESNPRIIVFLEGRIVGDDNHKELQGSSPAYEKLLGA